ncbi:MAG: YcjF family protein [Saprospiraceae bacterium]
MLTIEQTVERKEAAQKIIRRHILFSAGLGFIPFPIIDAAAILGNQVLMINDISDLYKVPFKKHLVKSFIGSLVSNLGAIGFVKFIPGLGSLLGGATVSAGATAATYALGKIFVQHFDQGGTLLNFDPVKSRKYFQQLHEEGKVAAQSLQEEEIVVTSKPLVAQNLETKMPLSKTRKVEEELVELEKKPTPTVAIQAPQKVVNQNMSSKKSVATPKQERSLLYRLRWLLLLLLVAILGWLAWQGYTQDRVEDTPEIEQIVPTKESQPPATELREIPAVEATSAITRDSTNK